jgi:hypothetical protein
MLKTPTFEEMFGVGKVPIASYFGLPKGASADTRFAPEARALLGQGEEYAREQAARDAEIAAEELLGGAADMTDADIQQQLLRSPKMFGTKAIQPLSGFMQYRQSMTPVSDETLGPVFREKITDPYHRERFDKRMLEEGLSANDAFDAYRTDEYNNKFEVALAEAGVPETEYAKLKTPSGKFIPGAVARAQQAAAVNAEKAKRELTRKVSDDPLDKKINAYEQAMKRREDIFKATGRETELAKDPIYAGYVAEIEKATKQQLEGVNPPPKPVVAPLKQVPAGASVAAPAGRPVAPELAEAQKVKEVEAQQKKAKVQEAQQIADAEWTRQKMKVENTLRQFYPPPTAPNQQDPLIGVAYSILDNAQVDTDTGGRTPTREPYRNLIKKKLGIVEDKRDPKTFIAFEEPGNQRTGPQGVTYDELLREWAEQVVAGYMAQNPQAAQPAGQQASSGGKIEIGSPSK